MIEVAAVIIALNFCVIAYGIAKYMAEISDKKHQENQIVDYIFAKCQKLGEQEEEMLSKRGVVNVQEFNKIDAKLDVLLELMAEINREEDV